MGSFGAAFLCLGLPARAFEILAAKTSGIAPTRIPAPVIATGVRVRAARAVLERDHRAPAPPRRLDGGHDGELFQSSGAFWYQRGNTLFEDLQGADRDSQTLQGVVIYKRDANGRLLRRVEADVAHIEADHRWRLENARFHQFPRGDPEAAPLTSMSASARRSSSAARAISRCWARIRAASRSCACASKPCGRPRGPRHRGLRSLWHARLADPFSVLLFAVLGAPLGFSVERARSLGAAAIQGVGLLGGYSALQTTASVLGAGGFAFAALAPWLVLAAFGTFCGVALRAARELRSRGAGAGPLIRGPGPRDT